MTPAAPDARIGPNAIIQVAGAVERMLGKTTAGELLRSVGLATYVDAPPLTMVRESEVIALHEAVRVRLAGDTACRIAQMAGVGTADYLLSHRIPGFAKLALRALPACLSSRLLLAAITRHSWTFAGSGRFSAQAGCPVVLVLEDCPLCRGAHGSAPQCDYYAFTFLRLFERLVEPRAHVRETACMAAGAAACRFEIDWP